MAADPAVVYRCGERWLASHDVTVLICSCGRRVPVNFTQRQWAYRQRQNNFADQMRDWEAARRRLPQEVARWERDWKSQVSWWKLCRAAILVGLGLILMTAFVALVSLVSASHPVWSLAVAVLTVVAVTLLWAWAQHHAVLIERWGRPQLDPAPKKPAAPLTDSQIAACELERRMAAEASRAAEQRERDWQDFARRAQHSREVNNQP